MEFLFVNNQKNTTFSNKIKYFKKNAENHLTNHTCSLIIWVSVLRHPYFIFNKIIWFAITGKPYFYFIKGGAV